MANGQSADSKGWCNSAAGNPEADLEGDLIVPHLAVLDVPPGLDHLEPFYVLDAFVGLCQCITDGVFYAARGRAYQLNFLVVVMVRHNVLLCRRSKPSSDCAKYFVGKLNGKGQANCTF